MKFTTIDGALLTLNIGPVTVQGTTAELVEVLEGRAPLNQTDILQLTQQTAELNRVVAQVLKELGENKSEADKPQFTEGDWPQWVEDMGLAAERLTSFLLKNQLWCLFDGSQSGDVAIEVIRCLQQKLSALESQPTVTIKDNAELAPASVAPEWVEILGADHEELARFLTANNWCSSNGERVVDVAIRAIETLQREVNDLASDRDAAAQALQSLKDVTQESADWKKQYDNLLETSQQHQRTDAVTIQQLRNEIDALKRAPQAPTIAPESALPSTAPKAPRKAPSVDERAAQTSDNPKLDYDPMWQDENGKPRRLTHKERAALSPEQAIARLKLKKKLDNQNQRNKKKPASNDHLKGATPQVAPQRTNDVPQVVEDEFTIEARRKREQVLNGLSESPAGAFGR